MLLDDIFVQSATPAISRYLCRVIDRGHANTDRLCNRRLAHGEYAKPLEQLLQVVTVWKMVLVSAGATVCTPDFDDHQRRRCPFGD